MSESTTSQSASQTDPESSLSDSGVNQSSMPQHSLLSRLYTGTAPSRWSGVGASTTS